MKTRILLLAVLSTFILNSCGNADQLTVQLAETEARLAESEQAREAAESRIADLEKQLEAPLVHLVLFDLKDELSDDEREAFRKTLEDLAVIEQIKSLRIGPFEDLGDKRALAKYEMIMEMSFDNEADYKTYQNDPRHIAGRKKTGQYVAGPPATYDFLLEK